MPLTIRKLQTYAKISAEKSRIAKIAWKKESKSFLFALCS